MTLDKTSVSDIDIERGSWAIPFGAQVIPFSAQVIPFCKSKRDHGRSPFLVLCMVQKLSSAQSRLIGLRYCNRLFAF